jgi:uncharacterized protein YbjT (DUF2867 family)
MTDTKTQTTLVLGGTGKTGRRVAQRLAAPGAVEAVGAFARLAVGSGVSRLVLLAGRGEPEAELAEQAVRDCGAELTIVRAAWFSQNFSEDYLLEPVLAGEVALPAGDTPEPFVDALDGRNARAAHGVRRAIGREPRDFARYARDAEASGAWDVPAASGADR